MITNPEMGPDSLVSEGAEKGGLAGRPDGGACGAVSDEAWAFRFLPRFRSPRPALGRRKAALRKAVLANNIYNPPFARVYAKLGVTLERPPSAAGLCRRYPAKWANPFGLGNRPKFRASGQAARGRARFLRQIIYGKSARMRCGENLGIPPEIYFQKIPAPQGKPIPGAFWAFHERA